MKIWTALFLFFYLAHSSCVSSLAPRKPAPWAIQFENTMAKLESRFKGEFGVYIQDLETQEEFSFKANESWYLSSTVKVPVAIALLQMVDHKKVKLTETVTIKKAHYRDGAGSVNWKKPGNKVTYQYLLEQMLIYSDNAATDLIIQKVGLDNVNKLAAAASDNGFGPITTLLDVRKKAYGKIHPKAKDLSNMAYFAIKKARTPKRRMKELAKQLKVKQTDFRTKTLAQGFEQYYSEDWNSATLTGYAKLLRNLISKKLLSRASTRKLLTIMANLQTGKKRIQYGLPRNVVFAHKTGTQHQRACDVGVAWRAESQRPKVLILVCTRNWKKLSDAEKIMAEIGRLVSKSDLL